MQIVTVSGKWQRRIVHTIAEADSPCTIKQLRIRCGMVSSHDPHGTIMRNILARLVARDVLVRCGHGLYALKNEG